MRRPQQEPSPASEEAAYLLGLRLLSHHPRTAEELRRALALRGVTEEAAAAALQRLAEVRLIDDARFAVAWVESRHHGRGLARKALAHELSRRGVEKHLVDAALTHVDQDSEEAMARKLVERRLTTLAGQPPEVQRRRLLALLARRGYSAGVASRVVREALAARGDAHDVDELLLHEDEE